MKVAVFVKQIPDPTGVGRLDPATYLLVRDGAELVMDPGDANGVEAALRVVEANGGEVVAMTMGGERAAEVLRKAMAMGAGSALHIADDRLRGSDALATARVLAAAVKRSGCELVVAGTESTDGYTGTVPAAVAELLGWPSLTFAKALEVESGTVRIHRQTPAGHDVVESPLPAVVTVTGAINEPRYPSLRGIMAAKSRPLELLTVDDLGIPPGEVGLAAAGQEVISAAPAPERAAGELIEDDGSAARRIADYLAELKVI